MMFERLIVSIPIIIALIGALLVVLTLRSTTISRNRSLSQHIMLSSANIIQGAILLTLSCLLLWVWVAMIDVGWFTKVALVLTGLSYLVTGWVPYGRGHLRDRLHDIAAWVGLAAMFAAVVLLSVKFGGVVAVVGGVAAVVQVANIGFYALTKPSHRPYMLLGQLVYLGAFLATIITVGIIHA